MDVLRGAPLFERLLSLPPHDRDAWTDQLLGIDSPPPDDPDLLRGSVPYLPCGVEDIMTAVREVPVGPDDDFVDLGSGLGRVVMLVHLLTGARARGIEIEKRLVRRARARAAALGLGDVSFLHADAAGIELEGSVFFLYAPFNGDMLVAVARRLEEVARRRQIVVCAVDLELHDLAWLTPRSTSSRSLVVYDSRAG